MACRHIEFVPLKKRTVRRKYTFAASTASSKNPATHILLRLTGKVMVGIKTGVRNNRELLKRGSFAYQTWACFQFTFLLKSVYSRCIQ